MANILKNELFQSRIIKLAPAVDFVDGTVLQEGFEAAAAEA